MGRRFGYYNPRKSTSHHIRRLRLSLNKFEQVYMMRYFGIVAALVAISVVTEGYAASACENTPPATCTDAWCSGLQSIGFCKFPWKAWADCSPDTPGNVEDNCQVECGTCNETRFELTASPVRDCSDVGKKSVE